MNISRKIPTLFLPHFKFQVMLLTHTNIFKQLVSLVENHSLSKITKTCSLFIF